MTRRELSEKFMKGSGVEIGALHSPWPIANDAQVTYLDRYTRDELISQYPEHNAETILSVGIVADGFRCRCIAPASQDFVISSHGLEHAEDALGTLDTWLSIIKPGGKLFLAVPEKTKTFDKDRDITTWEHFWSEYSDETAQKVNRRDHYEEYFVNVDKLSGQALKDAINKCDSEDFHIHFHTWTEQSLRRFLEEAKDIMMMTNFFVLHFSLEDHEVLAVLARIT